MTVQEERDATPSRSNGREAFRVALNKFVAGERVDMQQLAAELNVDRSTLFRWVGNRDTLLVDILTWLTNRALREAEGSATGSGGQRLARVAEIYAGKINSASYYRAFLQREPERALRLITTKASPLQRHVVQTFEALIDKELAKGFQHSMSSEDLAYLTVRIIESFVYADLITGEEPDAKKVHQAIAALLQVNRPA
ncbi:MAG: hypothetical protein AVDCRST_MAG33-2796 [uncultured Thermomicrobiales bacterium]|uniref:QsdR TetR regulatory C-terminal domain-containing protein n=1 Tax=uncultured Thermomicrobiales bacterium TaxID=1645740 RepID=A0A6J4VA10_9BACT|nr:MAG: hypothetical protein AVDCRST_MAG33-2796 [uncultured Thermomicrobiales bacterium]